MKIKKSVVKYKQFEIDGWIFTIRKYIGNENKLIYAISVSKSGFRSLGSYDNPREAINKAKLYIKAVSI